MSETSLKEAIKEIEKLKTEVAMLKVEIDKIKSTKVLKLIEGKNKTKPLIED